MHYNSDLYTKDPMRGYNIHKGSAEPVGFRVDPGFTSQIFERDPYNFGYHVFPSQVCDVRMSTKEVKTTEEFSKMTSERSSLSLHAEAPLDWGRAGFSQSQSENERIASKSMRENVSSHMLS